MIKKTARLNSRYWLFFILLQWSYGIDDNESWTSIGFETKLPYSLNLEFEQGLRLKEQLSTFKQTFSEASLSYKIFDGLRIFIPFRYAIFEDKIKQRLSFGGSYKYNLKPVSLKHRTKFQRIYENGELPDDLIRNKFSIKYRLNKKIEPYVSGELFHLYNTENDQLDQYRVSLGVAVDLPGKKSIKIFYIYKKEDIIKSNPDVINVFGLGYNFKL
mgnify:FL=1